MKKWMLGILLLLCMVGCGKKEVQTGEENEVTVEELTVTYAGTESFGLREMTVDENGIVYTAVYEWDTKAVCISLYDSNGVCVEEKLLRAAAGDVLLLESGKGVLYLVVPELDCFNVLYEIDATTWQAKRLYDFYEFSTIYRVIQIGEDVYVFGGLKNPPSKQYSQYSSEWPYTYSGETIVKLSKNGEVPVLEEVPIAFPIDVFPLSEDVIGVYCYTEDNGYVLGEYKQGKLEQKRQLMGTAYRDFRSCGEGFLYQKSIDRICYGSMDADVETDILLSSNFGGFSGLWMNYQNGFFYSRETGQEIQRVPMDAIWKENKTLQLLSSSWIQEQDIPNGCGYQMKKLTLDAEPFALKVLAQDTDFDLYLLSSRESTSYNLKKNGAFYPLNEVEGVAEYLDACFPYVKETAMNEDGDIWMIPVALTIPGLVYNKSFCAANDVDLMQMNMAEFVDFMVEVRKENPQYVSLSGMILREALFGQYLTKYDTFDTAMLREHAKQFKDAKAANWRLSSSAGNETLINLRTGSNIPDFYYNCIVYQASMNTYLDVVGDAALLGVAPIPKLEEGIPNIGTMTFMMVNPQSENLEDTLRYISDYAKSALQVKDSFILADYATYTDTPFAKECYELYANGGIFFEMEREVYLDTFTAYINGEIELKEMIKEMERRRKVYLGE